MRNLSDTDNQYDEVSKMNFRNAPILVLALLIAGMAGLLMVACGDDAEAPASPDPAAPAAPAAAPVAPASQSASAPASPMAPAPAAPAAPAAPGAPAPQATMAPAAPAYQPVTAPADTSGPVVNVVTTSNIVKDWVERVGGDRASVSSLLPVNADPHTFQPGARDIAGVADADLVFSVGLSLEAAWLEELLENAARDHDALIELGDFVDPIDFVELFAHDDDHGMDMHDDDHEDAHDHDMEDDDHDEGHAAARGRLLVASAEEAELSVVDLMSGWVYEHAFEVAAPGARVYSSPNHRFGFVTARGDGDNDDRTHIFDGGVYLVDHDDHQDLVSDPVMMLALETSDERPIHVANGGEWTTIFHDGTGRAALINEHELEEHGEGYEIIYWDAGLQHGAVVPMHGDLFAVSVANPDYPDKVDSSLPLGVDVRDLNNNVVYDASANSCPGLHGEAHTHDGVAFGCTGGVLFIEAHDGELDHWFIENPANMNPASRIGTLYGHEESDVLFGKASYRDGGQFVDDGLWLIDPEAGTITSVLPADDDHHRSVGSAFGQHGELLYTLTYGGELLVLDAHDGDVVSEAHLLDSVDPEATPSFIVVGETLYLADPASEHVIEFSLEEMEVEREWEVHGAPNRVAFLGIVSEEEHPEHGHDEEEMGHDEDEHEHEEDEHGHEEDEHGHEGHGHGEHDPHFWFDPPRVKVAVNHIAQSLSEIDPAGTALYAQNAAAYSLELDALHAWIQEQVAVIPEDDRLMVTSHDSFQYFAALYGFEIVGAVVPSISTDVEPTAQDLVSLVEAIEHTGARAVFTETIGTDRLVRRIAEETGISVVASLYTGSLGEAGGEAGTYIDMIRYDVITIVEALRR